MPAGLQVSDYDVICVPPGREWASAPLRAIRVPVTAATLDDLSIATRLRGVATQLMGGPNPITGRGMAGRALDNQTDYTSAQLGVPMRVWTLTVLGLINLDNISLPPPVIFRISTGTGNVVSARFTGVFSPNAWEYHEQLIQVSGLNATQLEIAARVDPAALPAAGRVEILLGVNVTQTDDATDRVWAGPNVLPGGP